MLTREKGGMEHAATEGAVRVSKSGSREKRPQKERQEESLTFIMKRNVRKSVLHPPILLISATKPRSKGVST